MKRIALLLIVLAFAFTSTGCSRTETATAKEANTVDEQLTQFSKGQPIPAFDYSFERDLVIQLYKLRNSKVTTHTVWRSDYGMIEGDCPSLGYGIPYDTSLTNPLALQSRLIDDGIGRVRTDGVVEQQEPNGIYASKNTTATWIMAVNTKTSQIEPIYIESKVTVYPYEVEVDYKTNRVHRKGASSASIQLDSRVNTGL